MTPVTVARLRRLLVGAACASALSFTVVTPALADVKIPPEVAAALQTFVTSPQSATTAWVDWAADQPMSFTTTAADGKSICQIDAARVTKCRYFDPKVSGKGYVPAGTDYTLADKKTQVFRYHGAWVHNNLAADTNPFTNTDRFYPYDYWLPWLTPSVPVGTSVDANGWYVVTTQNTKPGDDQSQVTVVRIAPDGLRAQFLQEDKSGQVAVRETIALTDVSTIHVPPSKKQHL